MRFTLIISTLFATTLAQNKCFWDVFGATQTINAGDSTKLNGIGVACGTASSPVSSNSHPQQFHSREPNALFLPRTQFSHTRTPLLYQSLTLKQQTFGVYSKCKVAYDQKVGTCDSFALGKSTDTIKCVYKKEGTPNYGTCKEISS